jgi:hypothetical protein
MAHVASTMLGHIRLDFLSAAKDPYVDGTRRIFVSDASSIAGNDNLLGVYKDPASTIIFPDDLPNEKILAELDSIAERQKSKLWRGEKSFINAHIGGEEIFSFDDSKNRIILSPASYPNLVADIERTQSILNPAFNKRHSVYIRCFMPENTSDDQWHKDRYLEPEKIFASRTLGPHGTMIATGKISANEAAPFPSEISGPFKLASAVHGGQGIYLFHGNTVHGIPKITEGRRWVYIFS